MKCLTTYLLCLFVSIGIVSAQTRTITGTVISADDGLPVIGASVIVKGTMVGTVTNVEGVFSLNVPENAQTLQISYVGMRVKEMPITPTMRIVLEPDVKALGEVVIVALGMAKDEKTLGYAATTVKSDDLISAKSGSMMEGLTGKVAGVNISSAGPAGSSQKVLIRGISSLNANQPLYIVDGVPINNERASDSYSSTGNYADFGNSANDINPDDVESVTVLKGASATALYGSRASNGVIMVTTKRAKAEKLTISYDGAFFASNVLRTMQTQDLFGQGWGTWDRAENGSWGPRLDGQIREWGSTQLDPVMKKPFSYVKDNIRDFYQTGTEMNNVVSVRFGTEQFGLYGSYANRSSTGILPNDGDKTSLNSFSLRGNAKYQKISFDMSVNYVRKDVRRTDQMEMELLQHAVDVSFKEMKDYNDPRYNLDNYYTYYATNPYWMIDNNYYLYQDDRVYGKVELGYDIMPGLKATGRLGGDFINSRQDAVSAKTSFTPGSYSDLGGATPQLGNYRRGRQSFSQIDAMAFLTADYTVGDFTLGGMAGWNLNQRGNSYLTSNVQGLDIPDWYNVQNTTSAAVTTQYDENRRLIGLFAQAELGFRNYLFLNLSARNDWSSTLPIDQNSYFYGGINASVILSELFPDLKASHVDFLKLRAAVGQTGNDAGVYRTGTTYRPVDEGYTRLPIGGVSGLTEDNLLPSKTLSPEMTTEYEFGLSANFLRNRISLDAAYYNKQTTDQIISAILPPETGYTEETRNVGKLENQGVELSLQLTPVRSDNWEWEIGGTFYKNWSEVKELWDKLDTYVFTTWRQVELVMNKGDKIGVLQVPAVARVEDKNSPYFGDIIVNNNGFPTTDSNKKDVIGGTQPDFVMGFTTSVRYKDFRLNVVADWRKGGWMVSNTSYITHFNGNSTQTVFNERNSFIYPNSVKIVDGQYVDNNIPVRTDQMNYVLGNYSYNPFIRNEFVIPKDFFKIREISLSYMVPKKYIARTPLSSLSLSLIGRNLFLFTPKENNYIDPEVSNLGNDLLSELGETTSYSSSRSFGASVKIEF